VLAQLKRTHEGATIPRIVFTKGGGLWLREMERLDCDVLGVDWTVNLGQARALVGASKALQGNVDPAVLFAPAAAIENEARKVLESFGAPHLGGGEGPTHIFNLGHGISQFTPAENVKVLVDAVHAHSVRMRTTPSA
jgi:uroporphyrinogen decarboxylase